MDPADVMRLRDATQEFVARVAIPAERELGTGEPSEELRTRLHGEAAEAGLLAPHAPREFGGLGLDLRLAGALEGSRCL